jgi:hypothetical protein
MLKEQDCCPMFIAFYMLCGALVFCMVLIVVHYEIFEHRYENYIKELETTCVLTMTKL